MGQAPLDGRLTAGMNSLQQYVQAGTMVLVLRGTGGGGTGGEMDKKGVGVKGRVINLLT